MLLSVLQKSEVAAKFYELQPPIEGNAKFRFCKRRILLLPATSTSDSCSLFGILSSTLNSIRRMADVVKTYKKLPRNSYDFKAQFEFVDKSHDVKTHKKLTNNCDFSLA